MSVTIHPTADVSSKAYVGEGTKIWHQAQIREEAIIGKNCVISKNVYVDAKVEIGNNVKVQNNVSIYQGVVIKDGVFIGPHVCFTNDRVPRAITKEGNPKTSDDWQVGKTIVHKGASIGANATILCGIEIGEFSLIGAGAVITKNVPPFTLMIGNPAKEVGKVDEVGNKV